MMAQYRDSYLPLEAVPREPVRPAAAHLNGEAARLHAAANEAAELEPMDRSLGALLSQMRQLSPAQIERILAEQDRKKLRFGEAAVALGLVSADDVMSALSQQFQYPYAVHDEQRLSPELVMMNQPFSAQAEVFRGLRSQFTMRVYGAAETSRRALAVVSATPGDGKSYVAANLAVSLAQLGDRTLLIDGDMRRPRQHEIFRLDPGAGLSSILSGRAEQGIVHEIASIPKLSVLPVGAVPPNPLELVERPAFALLLRELLLRFDHVVVDTPAANLGADSQVIADRCGAALGVARRHVSRAQALRKLADSLAGTRGELVGFVVNQR
jgi:protein-tyrosine kinase